MIEVGGEVIELEGRRALVRTASRSGGCGRCAEPGGCGGAKISNMFQSESADFWLENAIGAGVGDRVLVCLPEDASLNAALWGYMIPVAGIVLGAAIGMFAGGAAASDAHALGGALVGLAAGALVSRALSRRSATPEPVLRAMTGDPV